jgi:hypothetical protein
MITERNHWFGVYQQKTTRMIPIVVLERLTR